MQSRVSGVGCRVGEQSQPRYGIQGIRAQGVGLMDLQFRVQVFVGKVSTYTVRRQGPRGMFARVYDIYVQNTLIPILPDKSQPSPNQ